MFKKNFSGKPVPTKPIMVKKELKSLNRKKKTRTK